VSGLVHRRRRQNRRLPAGIAGDDRHRSHYPRDGRRVTLRRDNQRANLNMRIEIICTGDEVLTGKIVNTNFSYISQKLEDVGLSVRWGTTVGDDRVPLLAAFVQAGARADAVIVNGGLGPTIDDLSQEIVKR
jgi:Probable molybdopterin binding domain